MQVRLREAYPTVELEVLAKSLNGNADWLVSKRLQEVLLAVCRHILVPADRHHIRTSPLINTTTNSNIIIKNNNS